MTVYLVVSLPKTPSTHRVFMALANPSHTGHTWDNLHWKYFVQDGYTHGTSCTGNTLCRMVIQIREAGTNFRPENVVA